MTLAHRGMNWALLQNIASHLWNNIMDLTFKIKVRSVTYIRPVRWDPSHPTHKITFWRVDHHHLELTYLEV